MSKRKNGTWQVQLILGKDPKTGKVKRQSWTFDTRREAEAFETRTKAEQAHLAERHVRPSTQTLAEYLEGWLTRKEAEGLTARTMHDYRRLCKRYVVPVLGNVLLADLSPSMVQRWQDGWAAHRDAPGATQAAQTHRVLRAALSDACRLGMMAANPAKAARPAQRSPKKRPGFTLEEARCLLASAQGERLEPFFAFVLHSGLRTTEALGLRWQDVDLEREELAVRRDMVEVNGRMVAGKPKTQRSARTFAPLPQAVADIRRQKAQQAQERLQAGADWADEGLVFAAKNGHPLHLGNVNRAFRRVRERAGVRELPTYSLRHASASILLAAGVPIAVAAKTMGHSVTMFCETYADLLVEATREAAAMAGRYLEEQDRAAAAAQASAAGGTQEPTPIRKGRPRTPR